MPLMSPVPCSSSQGRRKIIRKLYTKLKHFQADDAPIPNPTLLEIKFYLKTNHRCRSIFVDNDTPFSSQPPATPSEHVSRFITSQLEAQRIADVDRQSVQLSTVLVVLSDYLATNPIQTASIPTLFFWRGTSQRRTFYLFAYLSQSMEARTYTAAELLSFRRSQSSDASSGMLAKLKADPEFGEVISKDKVNEARGARKVKGESSSTNESDEVVYRSKTIHRQSSQLDQPGVNTQWKYRGRTGSEMNFTDPLPAPTGLDKQSSEGFQRFFKAVVSPTHVRVTAGGRIVPNTRNSVSPTSKWDRERLPNDAQESVEPTKETKVAPLFAQTSNQMPMAPMVGPVYQPQPVVYQQMGVPIPFYQPVQPMQPMQPMQPGFPYPYGLTHLPSPMSNTQYMQMLEGEQRAQVIGARSKQNDGENNDKSRRAPITLSPPEQFDHTRPFYFNGQLVVPHNGMGAGTVPQSLHHNQFFASGGMQAAAHPDSRMVAANHPNANTPNAAGPNVPRPQPPAQTQPRAPERSPAPQPVFTPAAAPSGPMPPMSSIRPSEITKKQLENLRLSLKYWTSQLQFNRHQIDEPWVFAQANRVRDDIVQFEYNYQMQIRYEMECYPNMEPVPSHITELSLPINTPSRPTSIRNTQASGSSQHGSKRSNGQASNSKPFQPHQGGAGHRANSKLNRAAVGINSNVSDNSTAHIDALEAAVIRKLSSPDATPQEKEMLEAITRPLNPKYDARYQAAKQSSSDHSSSKESTRPIVLGDNQQKLGHIQSSALPNGLAMPYLVGNCPPGVDPWTTREFVYARELTVAEREARDTYWGGKPQRKGTGLPKFDGKDFYPASPRKTTTVDQGAQTNPGVDKGIQTNPSVDKGFQAKPTGMDYMTELKRSEVDPFRSSRDSNSVRSHGSSRKFSKAIPIVAPPDMVKKTDESAAKEPGKKSPPLSRRAVERSSVKSGQDLWQSMLKKGSTSATALPSAISSTTATGYLPHYAGNAIASFGPTMSNNSAARVPPNVDDKLVELDGPRTAMERTGENVPPSSAPSIEHDITKNLHQHMLRDAERRGVIGSDWQ
ncbi:hypothetical protein F4808DRAFT_472389 [Astrocystis sublimbata]|nr:hypothetical protein F4808DRAFT_472389 [Astrocystis sublimbata]